MGLDNWIAKEDDLILVTGATGFIGSRVVASLLDRGFKRIRCLARSSNGLAQLQEIIQNRGADTRTELVAGNLLSMDDCRKAAENVDLIYHLAAEGGRSFSGAFMNCVVTTRNIIEASLQCAHLRRFLNTSSFAVYGNRGKPQRGVLDETCPEEDQLSRRADAYCFAKLRQDDLVRRYGHDHGLPYVLVRPGVVYGPGKERIHGRVGLDTFGIFLHLGGSNPVPLTYVENCADAIVLAGLIKDVDGEVFNVVDDDLPTSRQFLRMYKKQVRSFRSIYVPHFASYLLCLLWEKYAEWSKGQLPPMHNLCEWAVCWKKTRYSNEKLKRRLGWTPAVPTSEGLSRFFASCREKGGHA